MYLSPPRGLGCCTFLGGGSVVVGILFNVLPIDCGSSVLFIFVLKRKRKLVALLLLSYRCIVYVNVLWLFLTVLWVGLQCVIVVFPDHTHLPYGYSYPVAYHSNTLQIFQMFH